MEEKFWLVTNCQWKSAKAVDELCKHQFKLCGKHISATPRASLMVTDWHFTQRQPTEWSHCHPTTLVKQCIMSPVKPLQCRSVTTHLFSQHSLASLSDCSVSSPNPDLSQQQRCRVAAALDFSGNTPSQSYCYWVPQGLFDLFWLRLIWNILVKILF